jgi:hypothetical protein
MDKFIDFILRICDDDLYYVLALAYIGTVLFSLGFIVAYTVM